MHVDNVNAFIGVHQTIFDSVTTLEVKTKVKCLIFWMEWLMQFSEVIECQFSDNFGNNWCGIQVGVLWCGIWITCVS